MESIVLANASHGGFDGGAQATDGTVEKDINLNIANCLKDMLILSGFEVVMTRTDDAGIEDDPNMSIKERKVSDMHNRLDIMNQYPDAIFVSIHLNKFTASSVSGAQVFYSKNNENSLPLAEAIQKSVASKLQPNNERVVKQGTSSTYLLHKTTIPAVIVECGFLSNQEELSLLKDENYQKKMAFAILCGICEYHKK